MLVYLDICRPNSKVKVIGRDSRSQKDNVSKVVVRPRVGGGGIFEYVTQRKLRKLCYCCGLRSVSVGLSNSSCARSSTLMTRLRSPEVGDCRVSQRQHF